MEFKVGEIVAFALISERPIIKEVEYAFVKEMVTGAKQAGIFDGYLSGQSKLFVRGKASDENMGNTDYAVEALRSLMKSYMIQLPLSVTYEEFSGSATTGNAGTVWYYVAIADDGTGDKPISFWS